MSWSSQKNWPDGNQIKLTKLKFWEHHFFSQLVTFKYLTFLYLVTYLFLFVTSVYSFTQYITYLAISFLFNLLIPLYNSLFIYFKKKIFIKSILKRTQVYIQIKQNSLLKVARLNLGQCNDLPSKNKPSFIIVSIRKRAVHTIFV